ncbi:MAG: DUF6851 domain-containing protein [Limnoraphis sp.]
MKKLLNTSTNISYQRNNYRTVLYEFLTISVLWDQAAQQTVIETKVSPTVASRAYGILHTGIFDAWAAYDPTAIATQLGDELQRPEAENTDANKTEAMSYSAYRVLTELFPEQVEIFDGLMLELGFDPNNITTDTTTAAGIGNVSAEALLEFRRQEAKAYYDYTRPVRLVRELGELGLIGEFNEELGGYAIVAWAGPEQGTQTILATDFITYQTPGSHVSPPFAEYVSGHSTFSASAATFLELATGSDSFGGSITFEPGGLFWFEPGLTPQQEVTLAWETFSEASDEAGTSRLYGGIHFEDGELGNKYIGLDWCKPCISRNLQVGKKAFKLLIFKDISNVYFDWVECERLFNYFQQYCLLKQVRYKVEDTFLLSNIERTLTIYTKITNKFLQKVKHNIIIIGGGDDYMAVFDQGEFHQGKEKLIIDGSTGMGKSNFITSLTLYEIYKNKQYKVEKIPLIPLCFSKGQEINKLLIRLGQQSVLKLLIETFTERLQPLAATHGSKLAKQLAKLKLSLGIVVPKPVPNQVKEIISMIIFNPIIFYTIKTENMVKFKGNNRQVKSLRLRPQEILNRSKSMCCNLSEQSKLISKDATPVQESSSSIKIKEQNGQDLLCEGLNTTNKHKIDYETILEEYYNLSVSSELSELDFERMDNILEMAESDELLSVLLNEIDYKVGQDIIAIEGEDDDFYEKKQARLVEFLNV